MIDNPIRKLVTSTFMVHNCMFRSRMIKNITDFYEDLQLTVSNIIYQHNVTVPYHYLMVWYKDHDYWRYILITYIGRIRRFQEIHWLEKTTHLLQKLPSVTSFKHAGLLTVTGLTSLTSKPTYFTGILFSYITRTNNLTSEKDS